MDYLQMHHPKLDNRTITVAECGVRIHELGGWVRGPGEITGPDGTPLPTTTPVQAVTPLDLSTPTTSEAATVPGSDDGQPAVTTDTGSVPGSDTEEEGTR